MNIAEALQEARQQIDRLDAEALLAHALDKGRTYLHTWPERQIETERLTQFQQLVARRHQGEPLAYLIGWREFWSLQIQVSPATLIPRPDTELLVEQALAKIPANADWRIADLGTGAGAIALALASERPRCKVIATDICPEALSVARANAQRLQLNNIEFRQGSWNEALKLGEQFRLIASNPPYIDADDDHLQGDGLPFEPQQALTPGKEGLSAILLIIEQMKPHLLKPGWLLLEHGHLQGAAVRTLFDQHGYTEILTHKDLGDNERMTQARWPAR